MIQISRGPEPAGFDRVRDNALTSLRATIADKGAAAHLDRSDFPVGYKTVGDSLRQRQYLKCCYCEVKIRHQGQDVEHFRPASKYWWLAYTWENLFFSCQNCNRWGKNAAFPLANEANRLTAENRPPGAEAPRLIDPAIEDPMDFLQFLPDPVSRSWKPRARDNSSRGAVTIRVLKLDANDLVELYDDHVKSHIQPEIDAAQRALGADDQPTFLACWKRLSVRFTQRSMPFSALAHDVVDHFFPQGARADLGVALARPS